MIYVHVPSLHQMHDIVAKFIAATSGAAAQ